MRRSTVLVIAIAAGGLVLATGLAFVLSRVLTRAYKEAGRATQRRAELLAVVSHDLRSPLSAILMHAELLARTTSPEQREQRLNRFMGSLLVSARSMKRLIDDLLEEAQLEGSPLLASPRSPEQGAISYEPISVTLVQHRPREGAREAGQRYLEPKRIRRM